ncbi:MAG: 5'-methylthioadenosine/S-adenosylhomocysteine nucleosidase [Clostridia bacterium]
MKRVGIVAAMTEEMRGIFKEMGQSKTETRGNRIVYIYQLNDKTIYIIKSGVGEIAAASAVQFLYDIYEVECILNFGVVGALHSGLKVAEVVVVDKVAHYDFDTSPFDHCIRGRYLNYESVYLPTSKVLSEKIACKCGLKLVTCASGDKFIVNSDIKAQLTKEFNADICEMEAAGIVLTADINNLPVLMIKAISDSEGGAIEFSIMLEKAVEKFSSIIRVTLEAI